MRDSTSFKKLLDMYMYLGLFFVGLFLGGIGFAYVHAHMLFLFLRLPTLLEKGLGSLADDFYANFSAELISIAITTFIINYVNERENRRHQKDDLRCQLGSHSHEFALEAARLLKLKEWGFGEDETLVGADLKEAKLHEAKLVEVNLSQADLYHANFVEAHLEGARFIDAKLMHANLSGAHLQNADFGGAYLMGVELQGANLSYANFAGANLHGANLTGAILKNAQLDDAICNDMTILCEGEHWTSNDNFAQYVRRRGD